MAEYRVPALEELTEQFERLPGIGHKSATRLAYYLINLSKDDVRKFSETIVSAHAKIHYCKICGNLTDTDICRICDDDRRDKSVLCVVESSRDVAAFEKMNEYKGQYHVLHGVISPMNGVLPDQLWIKELVQRIKDDHGTNYKEIILATSSTIEGEATATYISKLIKPFGIKLTRIAFGLPIGSEIEYIDEVTLSQAFGNRKEIW